MAALILLLGSNVKNKKAQLEMAESMISVQLGAITERSSVFETEPWGFEAEESFFNRVVIVESTMSPKTSLDICLSIENRMGRQRTHAGYASRIIDIDILFYGSETVNREGLKIPHPRLHLRRFVLEPLNELCPDFVHPEMGQTMQQLLLACTDSCWVKKLPV